MPKRGKQGPQPDAEGALPQKDPGAKGDRIAHPQIASAQTETQVKPGPEQNDHKHQISQPAGAEETKEPIKQAKTASQKQALTQMQPAVHRKSLRSSRSGLGSS